MKKNTKKVIITLIIIILVGVIIWLGYKVYTQNQESVTASENLYNHALYELADYMQNVESYLAKATISTGATHGAETLTNLWREANLAQTYLAMLPMESQDLENTAKFLNQVSDYSYSLSRKNIKGEKLSTDDLKNLEDLYNYSVNLNNVVNQISTDLNAGNITWKELTGDEKVDYAQQVNSDLDIATTLEDNFHEYSGLIYDGAYSEHILSKEKKGLTGDDISEEEATKKVEEFLGKDNIEQITNLGLSENGEIPSYTYDVDTKKIDNQYKIGNMKNRIQLQQIDNIGLVLYYDNPDYYDKDLKEQKTLLTQELNTYGFNFSENEKNIDKLRSLYNDKIVYNELN